MTTKSHNDQDELKEIVYSEVKSRLMHVADVSPEMLEHHASMTWRKLEPAITKWSQRQVHEAELHGRLHELIEWFQNGNITAERYSERHAELTEAISALTKAERDV